MNNIATNAIRMAVTTCPPPRSLSTPKTDIDGLSYREESLDMRVKAPSLAALSQLSQFIGKQGMTAEIQSSTPVASGVEAHIQLRSSKSPAHR